MTSHCAAKRRISQSQVPVPTALDKTTSRMKLLVWVNEVVKANYKSIEQLYTGDVYCLLNNILFPDSINLIAVKWNCRRESEAIDNWRMLEKDWKSRVVNKNIPYDSLVKGKFRDNYEWLQWYKPFFELNYDSKTPFDPVAMRNGVKLPSDKSQKPPFNLSSKNVSDTSKQKVTKTGPPSITMPPRQLATPRLYITGQEILADVDNQMYAENQAAMNERDYYHGKCSEVEKLCKATTSEDRDVTELVFAILKVLGVRDQSVEEEKTRVEVPAEKKINNEANISSPRLKEEKPSDEDVTATKTPVPKEEKISSETTKKEEGESGEEVANVCVSPARSSIEKKPSDRVHAVNPKPELPDEKKHGVEAIKTEKKEKSSDEVATATEPRVPKSNGEVAKVYSHVWSSNERKPSDENVSASVKSSGPKEEKISSETTKKEEGESSEEVAKVHVNSSRSSGGKPSVENVSVSVKPSSPKEEKHNIETVNSPARSSTEKKPSDENVSVNVNPSSPKGEKISNKATASPARSKKEKLSGETDFKTLLPGGEEPSDETTNIETKSSASKKSKKKRNKNKGAKGKNGKEDKHDEVTSTK